MDFKQTPIGVGTGPDLLVVVWKNITEADNAPECKTNGQFTTVQVAGDANGVHILGKVGGDNFDMLSDTESLPLSFSFAGIKSCADMYQAIKPKKSGPGTATVTMIIRRN